ncbi:putative bifunctional diguanylate cyclase/phosphodiesterase [Cellulomonas soli]|uniref:putative bifunctional diguanylate cyclase/phosphodiesterase n=1 Tax=Cellulomonas soli TaxID=931535 RepID=UPI003F87445B
MEVDLAGVHRRWAGYLAGATLSVALWSVAPSGLPKDVMFVVVGLVGVAAAFVGIRLNKPPRRAPWYLLAAGQLIFVSGDVVYTWYLDLLHVEPYPSPADALYLLAYPVLAAGLLLFVRARRAERDLATLVDSSILAVAVGTVGWVLISDAVAAAGTPAEQALALAYPAGDLVLLATLVRLASGPGARSVSYRLLMASMSALFAADVCFTFLGEEVAGGGTWFDLLFLASYVLLGAAALHPSMRGLCEPAATERRFSRRRMIGLSLAVLVAPALEALELLGGVPVDGWQVKVANLLLVGLALIRLYLAVLEARAEAGRRVQVQDDLAHQAAHDALTGIANRAAVLDETAAALDRAHTTGHDVGLLLVSLDHFRAVNDRYGRGTGDAVLRTIARRIRRTARPGDLVGRVGGDELALLVQQPGSPDELAGLGARILEIVQLPVMVGDREIHVTASVGVTSSRRGDADAEHLLQEAEAAVTQARGEGRGRVAEFDEALRCEMRDRAELESAIRDGLATGEFMLHYQPVVDVASGAVTGYEALARWERPGHGLVSPAGFVPVAEQSSLVCELGRWALRTALAQAATWRLDRPAGEPELTVAVNISGRHLVTRTIVDEVEAALAVTGMPARLLTVEITETVLVDHPSARAQMAALRAIGVGVSIDDFGTGYTSIGQLQHLPATALKIDRSLVSSGDTGARELVALVAQAAHAFGMSVVAEGVETADQLAAVRHAGCDHVQGYLLARPAPADQLTVVAVR